MIDLVADADMPDGALLLSETISRAPDEPVNYILRGEMWLSVGDTGRAAADFLKARELAERRWASSAWGYLDQAYRDRAEAGLAACGSSGARQREPEQSLRL